MFGIDQAVNAFSTAALVTSLNGLGRVLLDFSKSGLDLEQGKLSLRPTRFIRFRLRLQVSFCKSRSKTSIAG